ncbi:MAG: hypothetical protein ACR2H4_04735 [Pyrinomonadaceae bacterium]
MSDLKRFERLRFFSERLLTAADFSLEQNYFRGKLKLHNRALHGFGIVSGLKVTVQSGKVVVTAGLALDCEGNELVVARDESLAGPPASWQTAYVNLHYVEQESNDGAFANQATIIQESSVLKCDQQNFNSKHRHLRGRWLSCGSCHPLTIARLRPRAGGWRVDRRYRPPAVK